MFAISNDLTEYFESGVAISIGTGDSERRAQMAFAWGLRVVDPAGIIDLFVDRAPGELALRNLKQNPNIAAVFSDPITYRSVQLKGTCLAVEEPADDDIDWVRRHHESFAASTALVGDPPHAIRNLWTDDVVRLRIRVDSAFDQTPGPNAGAPL